MSERKLIGCIERTNAELFTSALRTYHRIYTVDIEYHNNEVDRGFVWLQTSERKAEMLRAFLEGFRAALLLQTV